MISRMCFAMAMACMGLLGFAESRADEVDQAAVLRLGNVVQYVGDGIGDDGTDAFVEAMAPPANDGDKWFVSIVTLPGCVACEKLKDDWSKSEALLALAIPDDPKRSWAHFNTYDIKDASQAFRFEKLRIRTFPTVLVQPPRSGKYGEPATVVFQGVYNGKPDDLAKSIVGAIRQYVAKVAPATARQGAGQAIGVDPPWQPTPRVAPRPANDPIIDPTIPPPAPAPQSTSWATILALLLGGGFSASAIIGLVVLGLQAYRGYRKATHQPVVLTDEQFAALVAALQGLAIAKSAAKPQ